MNRRYLNRRNLLRVAGAAGVTELASLPLPAWAAQADTPTSAITPSEAWVARALQFPRDFGSHPEFSVEWWYLTGYLHFIDENAAKPSSLLGFQLTFFRKRVPETQTMRSAFAAKQLIVAHAALTDVAQQTLWHDQAIAREGFGIALASPTDTAVKLRGWSLQRNAAHDGDAALWLGPYRAQVQTPHFSLDLALQPTQPPLLQGKQGLSRKGPQATQTSYYYSQPQLKVSGMLKAAESGAPTPRRVQGTAWLDHEWSQTMMHPQAVGWDWIGMNLFDGSALTAFVLRQQNGQALWHGGSFRRGNAGAAPLVLGNADIVFEPQRIWSSPLTAARYPVVWRVTVRLPDAPSTPRTYTVKAMFDNQELDSRQSTGAVYWEGLCELLDEQAQRIGQGYLEMTGYASPIKL